MLCYKDPRETYKQPDLSLRIQFLITLYKLFSPEESALCKHLLMQRRLCQTGDMDMDAPPKVQEEPLGEAGEGRPRSQRQG